MGGATEYALPQADRRCARFVRVFFLGGGMMMTGWWFQIFFIFIAIWDPNLYSSKWVETTN